VLNETLGVSLIGVRCSLCFLHCVALMSSAEVLNSLQFEEPMIGMRSAWWGDVEDACWRGCGSKNS
jgi:hypothetical protein